MRFVLAACALMFCIVAVSATPDTLRLGLGGEPATLDPHRYNLRIEETVLTDLFEGLVTFDAHGKISPGVALRWEASQDGLTWTFELRSDALWSDGVPVTANDFKFAFKRLLDPDTAASLAYFMYPLKNARAVARGELPVDALGVEAPDDHTLIVRLEAPYPHLPERLLYPTAYPVPEHIISQVGDDWVKAANWVSNGAYTLKAWRPQEAITLAANPHFRQAPTITHVDYVSVASAQAAYNRYRTNDLHAIAAFPPGEVERLRKERPRELHRAVLQSAIYLVFNTRRKPFDQRAVREALSIVIDPQLIAHRVLAGAAEPALTLVPQMVPDYKRPKPGHLALSRSQRAERAKELLNQAGYASSEPLRITLAHAAATQNKRACLAVAAMWRAIGVHTKLHQSELRAHYGDLRQGEFEVAHAAWLGESNPEHYLALLYGKSGATNYGAYRHQGFDVLFEDALQQATIARRHTLLSEAEATALADFPLVPLYAAASRRLVRTELQGWQDNARDVHPVRYLSWAE